MRKEEVSPSQFTKILDYIVPSIMKNGIKGTTMDSIAASLQMSKRTLYEIFGNKEEMFQEAHKYFHAKVATALRKIFEDSSNIMEAIIKSFLYNRDMMSNVNVEFIHDMERLAHKNELKESDRRHHYEIFYDVLEKGVNEGFFRDDVNLKVQCRMLTIQMDALKRTEELFPEDISLLEVYDSIIIGFLRGISSQKGLDELEKFIPAITSKHIHKN